MPAPHPGTTWPLLSCGFSPELPLWAVVFLPMRLLFIGTGFLLVSVSLASSLLPPARLPLSPRNRSLLDYHTAHPQPQALPSHRGT